MKLAIIPNFLQFEMKGGSISIVIIFIQYLWTIQTLSKHTSLLLDYFFKSRQNCFDVPSELKMDRETCIMKTVKPFFKK